MPILSPIDWSGIRAIRARSQNDRKADGSYVFPPHERDEMTPAAQRQAAFRQRRDARLAGYKEALEAIVEMSRGGDAHLSHNARTMVAIAVEALKL